MPNEQEVLNALPASGFLHDFVLWAKDRTDAHVAYHVACALPVIAQTIPQELYFPTGLEIRSNLFSLIVGNSTSSRKTTCAEFARDVLTLAMPAAVGETPGSYEALVDNLVASPRQLLIYPEFGTFLATSTPDKYLHTLRTLYTSAYDCTPFSRSLVKKAGKREITPVKNPRLSLLGAVTSQFLEDYTTPTDWMSGFLGRFFTIEAERERTIHLSTPDCAGRDRLVQTLASYTDINVIAGVCRGFEPHAKKMWQDRLIETDQEVRKKAERGREYIKAALARAPTMALKIALILAWDLGLARQGTDWWMPESILKTALAFMEWHLESVKHIGSHLASGKDMRDRRRIMTLIEEDDVITQADLLKNSGMLKRRFMEVIETLVVSQEVITTYNLETGDLAYKARRKSDIPTKAAQEQLIIEGDPHYTMDDGSPMPEHMRKKLIN